MLSYETLLLVAFAFLLGGFVKGVVGLGVPVVVLACLTTTVGLKETMAILLFPAAAMNVWQGLSGGAFVMLIKRLWPSLISAVVGIWIGVKILVSVDTDWMVVVLGVMLFIYAAFSLLRTQISPPGKHEIWMSPVVGLVSGITFGASGSYIVPGVLYLQALGLSRDHLIQALGITFFIIATVLGILFWQHRLIDMQTAGISVVAFVPLSLGVFLGRRYRYSLSEDVFRKIFFVSLLFVGIYMVTRVLF